MSSDAFIRRHQRREITDAELLSGDRQLACDGPAGRHACGEPLSHVLDVISDVIELVKGLRVFPDRSVGFWGVDDAYLAALVHQILTVAAAKLLPTSAASTR